MSDRYTVFIDDDRWRLGCVVDGRAQVIVVESPDDADVSSNVQRIQSHMAEQGGHGPVMLALPSHWCLSAIIDTHELSRSNRRQSMRYVLEEHLPISAEDFVADFIEKQGAALGVAVDLERLRPIVDAFQELGIVVQAITPGSLLVASRIVEQYSDATWVAINSGSGIDLFEVSRGVPTRWLWLSDVSELSESLSHGDVPQFEEARQLVVLGLPETCCDPLTDVAFVPAEMDDLDVDPLAIQAAEQVLAGDVSAWIDLRRDALQAPERYQFLQKQMALMVAAMVFFLACVFGATYWRGEQYKAYADERAADQIGVFKQAMPGQRVPSSIISRLQSEQRRLSGISGRAGGDQAGGLSGLQPTSALTQMHTVLTVWPDTLRYRISDLTIEPNLIRVNGQAADSVIPETLAAALRGTGGYEVDPPNTRALRDYGFTFGFIARPTADGDSPADASEAGS